ncbi:MAG: hypothetical protein HY698_02650 [Deltaproteobacteria bacterium]|nr:hypothetical protein [Deltaproteobacteria bacterium]
MARKKLGELLVQAGVLDEARLRVALAEQRRWGGPLGRILVDMKLITEDAMVQALSHQLNFPAVNLDQRSIAMEVLDLVPADLAEQHSVVPFNVQGKFIDVAMADPTNLGIIDELRIRTRLNVRPYLAGPKMIERAISRYYGRGMGTAANSYALAGGHPTIDPASMPLNAQVFEVATDHGLRAYDYGRTGATAPGVPSPLSPGASSVGAAAVGAGQVVVPQGGVNSGPTSAAARRAQAFEMTEAASREHERNQEIAALQARVQHLEALVARDEDVLRTVLSLLIEKGIATREEVLERIK